MFLFQEPTVKQNMSFISFIITDHTCLAWLCDFTVAYHHGGPGSSPTMSMQDLWRMKCNLVHMLLWAHQFSLPTTAPLMLYTHLLTGADRQGPSWATVIKHSVSNQLQLNNRTRNVQNIPSGANLINNSKQRIFHIWLVQSKTVSCYNQTCLCCNVFYLTLFNALLFSALPFNAHWLPLCTTTFNIQIFNMLPTECRALEVSPCSIKWLVFHNCGGVCLLCSTNWIFRRIGKIVKSDYWIHHVCPPSVRPHAETRLPLDRFSWNLMFECFFENLYSKSKFH
jgi:hypothetical protein